MARSKTAENPEVAARKIRELVEDFQQQGYSLQAIAGILGLHKSYLSKIARGGDGGRTSVGSAAIRAVAERMKVDPAYFSDPSDKTFEEYRQEKLDESLSNPFAEPSKVPTGPDVQWLAGGGIGEVELLCEYGPIGARGPRTSKFAEDAEKIGPAARAYALATSFLESDAVRIAEAIRVAYERGDRAATLRLGGVFAAALHQTLINEEAGPSSYGAYHSHELEDAVSEAEKILSSPRR